MTTVPSTVELDPLVVTATPPERPLPERVTAAINGAGFPAELGDAATLFRYVHLDDRSPTVSHLLVNGGLAAYNRFGMAIQRAIMALNRLENPRFGMRTIGSDFIALDPQRLAALPPAVRESVRVALERMTRELGGPVTGPIEGDTDVVERRARPEQRGPRPAGLETPRPTARNLGPPLPHHPALEGISDSYRTWLQRGDHRMETVEALLGHRPESFEAGLGEVQRRYGLGTPHRPRHLEEAAQALQAQLGVPGAPDGKFGRVSTPFLRNARDRYRGDRLTTPEGRRAARAELQGKDTLAAAISEQLGADRPPESDAPRTVTSGEPRVERRDERREDERHDPPPQAPVNPYVELAGLRQNNRPEYETRRNRIVGSTQNNPQAMATIFREAYAIDRDTAFDLATSWLDAHTPSVLPSNEMATARRTFARLAAEDRVATATMPAALNDRLARSLAPITPSQGLFSPPTGDDLTALSVYESNRVARAISLDDLIKDDRNRYGTLMWASPAVVALTVTRLASADSHAAHDFGNALAKHLQSGGPVATLDGRVDPAYAIFQLLREPTRANVEEGMRGMGSVFGLNLLGITDTLIDRVAKPRPPAQ